MKRQWISDAAQDVRHALRQCRQAPMFAALVVFTLAFGVGANASMAVAIDRLLLRAPSHVRDPDRVVRILRLSTDAAGGTSVSPRLNYPAFRDLQRGVEAFETIGGYSHASLSFGEGERAVEVRASMVTSAFFSVFGVSPHYGRLFVPSDDESARIAVLGYGFWTSSLGADSAVVGRTIRVGSERYTIVGVSPQGFQGVETRSTDVWLPVTVAAVRDLGIPLSLEDRGSAWLSLVGRLRSGVQRASAQSQATGLLLEHHPGPPGFAGPRIVLASAVLGRGPDRPREVNIAFWLAAVSALVLLIACANVANLLLARAIARQRNIAVRLAMGAARERLARQFAVEGLVLATLGGIAAVFVAAAGGSVMNNLFLYDAARESTLSVRLLVITGVVALGAGILISLAPAISATSLNLSRSLRDAEGLTSGRAARPLFWLLGAQAAVCMCLLLLAGLFAQSLRRVQSLDLGLDLDRTVIARIELDQMMPRAEVRALFESMLVRARGVDEVRHAAISAPDPFTFGRAIPAHTPRRSEEELWHREGVRTVPKEVMVDSGFFTALGTTTLRGRDFNGGDRRGAPRVAIVNKRLADILWPGEEPLGQCMLITFAGGECVTVVGVVQGFLRRTILDRDQLAVYLPMAQSNSYVRPGSILLAVAGDPHAVALRVRQVLQGMRPDLPAISIAPMRDVLREQFRPWEVAATMFSIFGVLALVIAVIGLYAVVEFASVCRARETAIRIALGARMRDVSTVVAGRAGGVVAIGLSIGALVVWGVRGWLGALLFQTSASDPRIIAGVTLLLLSAALVAAVVPILRVLRRNLAMSLRVDSI